MASAYKIPSQVKGHSTELRFPVPWGHLAAKSWGPQEGPPVLCLHGWQDNANTFDRLIPLLPKGYHYVSLDFSGHGLSSHKPPAARYDFFDYVTDTCRVVRALGWKHFSIMAHSLGSLVATIVACTYPGMVTCLILLDTYGFYPMESSIIVSFKYHILSYAFTDVPKAQKTYTPETALQRLLEGLHTLTPESGKVLIQRGTKETPNGVIFRRDPRVSLDCMPPFTLEQYCDMIRLLQADILVIRASNGLISQEETANADRWTGLLEGYKARVKV
ncbi:serine hydrolase-like protein 2 [Discoglossus pictus]